MPTISSFSRIDSSASFRLRCDSFLFFMVLSGRSYSLIHWLISVCFSSDPHDLLNQSGSNAAGGSGEASVFWAAAGGATKVKEHCQHCCGDRYELEDTCCAF